MASTLVSLMLLGCGSGGSSGEDPNINEQTPFSETSFSYADEKDPEFHPLGSEEFVAVRRDETLLVVGGGGFSHSDRVYYREDESQVASFAPLGGAWIDAQYFGFHPLSASLGDLDGDGRPEPVIVGADKGEVETEPYVRIGQPDRVGGINGMDHCLSFPLSDPMHMGSAFDMAVEAADVDGDGIDELIVAESWFELELTRLRVFELTDTLQGPAPVELHRQLLPTEGAWLGSGQFDEDVAEEVLITSWIGDVANIELFDDLNTGFGSWGLFAGPIQKPRFAPLVGQFDDDAYAEVILESYNKFDQSGGIRRGLELWDGQAAFPNYQQMAETFTVQFAPIDAASGSGLVRADRDRNGHPEVLWVVTEEGGVGDAEILLSSWEPATDARRSYLLEPARDWAVYPAIAADLCVVDDAGKGRDNVLVGVANGEALPGVLRIYELEHGAVPHGQPGASLPTYEELDANMSITSIPMLVAADFDDDGLRLRWTGNKHTELPAPIPMVLLAAPPTKAGIDQNYDDTGSTYSVSNTAERALEVAMGASVSVSIGFEVEDLFGLFGVESTATIEAAYEKSIGFGSSITTTSSFSGGFEKDSIVFAGVLQRVYDYEVLAAPNEAVIGTIMTINQPVESRVFKWSLDFYNQSVAAQYAIAPSVLGHTIGDPLTYPRKAGLTGLLKSQGGPYDGWAGDENTVGEVGGTNGVALEIENVVNVGDTVSFSVEVSAEVKAGGATVGATVGLFGGVTYTVTTAHSTTFEGEIGDIVGNDWSDWFYGFGIVVYRREVQGDLPYQVLHYWTEPLGIAYP